VPLRLAFDLDGVLADMESALVRQAEAVFGEAMTLRFLNPQPSAVAEPINDSEKSSDPTAEPTSAADDVDQAPSIARLHLTTRQERRLWRHIETVENFWESLDEIEPGIIRRLATLASDRRWEIIFLTKRPSSAGATAQVQTQRWLESKGFRLPSVYVVQGNRGRIAAAFDLDFVIDDRPENCLDVVVDSKARTILVWRGDEKQLPAAARRLGVGIVKSVEECLAVLTQVDRPAADVPGVIHRVMRLFRSRQS
jgi:hypothetical protein